MKYRALEEILETAKDDLSESGSEKTLLEHVQNCATSSLATGTIFFLFANIFASVEMSLLLSVAVVLMTFLHLFFAPRRICAKRAQLVEKDLPFALLRLSLELNVGRDFESALSGMADANYGELSVCIRHALELFHSKGCSIEQSLLTVCGRLKSESFTRACMQMISAYESGGQGQGENIRKLALEILSLRKSQLREHSEKSALLTLVFIAFSAILPVLFSAFVLVGGRFLGIEISLWQFFATVCIAFPAIDIAILYLGESIKPQFMKVA